MSDMERMTLDNGEESDVAPTDYKCSECSTDTLEIFHSAAIREPRDE